MKRLKLLVIASFTLVVIGEISAVQSAEPTQAKAVRVTGAGTGIGRKITERLAADGYFVYATARKPEDLKALGAIKNVQALRLDATHPEDTAAPLARVTKAGP